MRRALTAAAALALLSQPLEAQSRRWVLAAGGALLGLGLTTLYSSGSYSRSIGWCSSVRCVGITTTVGGSLVGYLIGHDQDERYRLRYRVAPPLEVSGRTRMLRTRPTGLELGAGIVAVSGDDGVELVSAQPRLEYLGHRARGLRNIQDVSAPTDSARILVGTSTGLYLFAVSGDAAGLRALDGEVSAVAIRGNRVAVTAGGVLRLGTVTGDSVRWRIDTLALTGRVADARWQDDTTLWLLTDRQLASYRVPADSAATPIASVVLEGPARRFTIRDTLAAVAAGAAGVYLVQINDPARPRVLAHWTEARFAYDVALWGVDIYVAAGPEGLYVLRPGLGHLEAIGLARSVGFVAALAAGSDALYALDRTGGVLRRIELTPVPTGR
ncbi:MAG TPA: hypothetical protein VF923_07530 [Gemmatimonadales bacterium]